MGFCEILFIVFMVLKLCGVVGWSWWVVCIPMYPAILIYGIIIAAICAGSLGGILYLISLPIQKVIKLIKR